MVPIPPKTLTQLWDLCKPEFLPSDASAAELGRAQQAFRAGAWSVLGLMATAAARVDQTPGVKKVLSELASALHHHHRT